VRVRIGLVAAIAALTAFPAAAHAVAPQNDNYLNYVQTNSPGSQIPRNTTLDWTIPGDDVNPAATIDDATTQANMGDASATPEQTSCNSADGSFVPNITRTVWYWTFPDINGWYQIEIRGGDAVIRTIPVGAGNVPVFGGSRCWDDSTNADPVEIDFFGVQGGPGAAYAIQAGAYGSSVFTQHRTLITFFPDRDLDRIFDQNDRCPTQVGPSSLRGCPDTDGDGVPNVDDGCDTVRGPRNLGGCPDSDGDGLTDVRDACDGESSRGRTDRNANGCPDYGSIPDLRVSIEGRIKRNKVVGVRFTRLRFRSRAPRGTRIRVSCRPRRSCRLRRRGSLRRRIRSHTFRGRRTRIRITATRRGYVGKVFTMTVSFKTVSGGGRTVRLRGPSKRCIPVGRRRSTRCRSSLLLR
jgi:hypothetical protein